MCHRKSQEAGGHEQNDSSQTPRNTVYDCIDKGFGPFFDVPRHWKVEEFDPSLVDGIPKGPIAQFHDDARYETGRDGNGQGSKQETNRQKNQREAKPQAF